MDGGSLYTFHVFFCPSYLYQRYFTSFYYTWERSTIIIFHKCFISVSFFKYLVFISILNITLFSFMILPADVWWSDAKVTTNSKIIQGEAPILNLFFLLFHKTLLKRMQSSSKWRICVQSTEQKENKSETVDARLFIPGPYHDTSEEPISRRKKRNNQSWMDLITCKRVSKHQ